MTSLTTDIVMFDPKREEIHVLVVDANPLDLKSLEEKLILFHYQVTVSDDFDKAYSILKDGDKKFDIAMIDVHQHDTEGYYLMETAAEMDIFTIQISAVCEYVDVLVREGIQCGEDLFMLKPIGLDNVSCLWQHVYSKQVREDFFKNHSKKSNNSSDTSENSSSPNDSGNENEIMIKEEDGDDHEGLDQREETGDY